MSAHYRAPGLRRPQLATPSLTASLEDPSISPRSGGSHRPRRRALFVAAATLCAPAFAALALAAIGATGGGDQAAMGSLAGTHGLRGTTTPVEGSPPPASPVKPKSLVKQAAGNDSAPTREVQHQPASKAPSPAPTRRPAPTAPVN